MKRPFILVGILLIIGAAAGSAWWWRQPRNLPGSALTLYGNIEIRDARLAFNEQELVAAVEAEEGDTVSAGQVLARLRSDRLKDQLAGGLATLEAQKQVVSRLKAGTTGRCPAVW